MKDFDDDYEDKDEELRMMRTTMTTQLVLVGRYGNSLMKLSSVHASLLLIKYLNFRGFCVNEM